MQLFLLNFVFKTQQYHLFCEKNASPVFGESSSPALPFKLLLICENMYWEMFYYVHMLRFSLTITAILHLG